MVCLATPTLALRQNLPLPATSPPAMKVTKSGRSTKATNYFQVDVSGLPVRPVIDPSVSNVYVVPSNDLLCLENRLIGYGEVGAL